MQSGICMIELSLESGSIIVVLAAKHSAIILLLLDDLRRVLYLIDTLGFQSINMACLKKQTCSVCILRYSNGDLIKRN